MITTIEDSWRITSDSNMVLEVPRRPYQLVHRLSRINCRTAFCGEEFMQEKVPQIDGVSKGKEHP